jgi:nitrous oxidase accessory protein
LPIFNIKIVRARTIVVPDDYTTIQAAIDAALPGDTVFVRKGIYRENLFIGKALSLVGEDWQQTIIDGCGTGHVVYIKADNVKVAGFTIKNSSSEYPYSGIYLDESNGCHIYGNNITAMYYGIRIYNSSNNYVSQNYVSRVYGSSSSTIGIELAWSHNNTINNNYLHIYYTGIKLAESTNNFVERNILQPYYGGGYAFDVDYNSDFNTFSNNNVTSSHKPGYSERYFSHGFYIRNSVGNVLQGNKMRASSTCIYLYASNNTIMVENDFTYADYAINLQYSHFCVFYHNNIFEGSIRFSSNLIGNLWDNGYPSGGNYWKYQSPKSDYYSGPNQDQPGSDGIVDKPYDLGYGNKDRYPFMNPYREPCFEVSASPQSQKFYAPQTRSYTIIITSVNSFILPVNLSCSWFGATPSGITFSLSRSTITPPPNGKETSNLTVTASSTAVAGTYTLRIAGASESLTNYVDIVVTVLSASLDITPPEIGEPMQTPSNNTIQPNEKVKISVIARDDESGINQVILLYTTDNGTTWTNLNMQLNATTSSYEVEVPEQQPGTVVKYKIIAYDNAGNSAIKDNNGYYYTYQVIPEFPSPIILLLFTLTTLISVIFVKEREKLSLHLEENVNRLRKQNSTCFC